MRPVSTFGSVKETLEEVRERREPALLGNLVVGSLFQTLKAHETFKIREKTNESGTMQEQQNSDEEDAWCTIKETDDFYQLDSPIILPQRDGAYQEELDREMDEFMKMIRQGEDETVEDSQPPENAPPTSHSRLVATGPSAAQNIYSQPPLFIAPTPQQPVFAYEPALHTITPTSIPDSVVMPRAPPLQMHVSTERRIDIDPNQPNLGTFTQAPADIRPRNAILERATNLSHNITAAPGMLFNDNISQTRSYPQPYAHPQMPVPPTMPNIHIPNTEYDALRRMLESFHNAGYLEALRENPI